MRKIMRQLNSFPQKYLFENFVKIYKFQGFTGLKFCLKLVPKCSVFVKFFFLFMQVEQMESVLAEGFIHIRQNLEMVRTPENLGSPGECRFRKISFAGIALHLRLGQCGVDLFHRLVRS